MQIINRIMLSSALLVFLSLTLLLAAISIGLYSLGPEPVERLDDNAFLVGKLFDELDPSVHDWSAIAGDLAQYGYDLLVLDNEQLIYPTPNPQALQVADKLRTIPLGDKIIWGEKDGFVVTAAQYGGYALFAARENVQSSKENVFTEFLLPYLSISSVALIIILLFSQFFTRKLAWRILSPLNNLVAGAKRIENGDLSKPIAYGGNDEFAPVCTAFNHMQEHLLEELAKNAAYEQARINLVAGISHDLRTPLTSVKGFIKGLRDGIANTPEKRKQYLDIAYQKTCDMEVLLERLFDFSALEAGKLSLCVKVEDLGDFARSFADEMRAELAQYNIAIHAEATAAAHPTAMDAGQIRRVLLNLVENAIRYADAEQLTLTLQVYQAAGYEHLIFADNGKGLPQACLPQLFDRFWRGDETRNPKNGAGNGLGLFIAQYIIQAHGGTIMAENRNGLNLDIALPCAKEGLHEQDPDS